MGLKMFNSMLSKKDFYFLFILCFVTFLVGGSIIHVLSLTFFYGIQFTVNKRTWDSILSTCLLVRANYTFSFVSYQIKIYIDTKAFNFDVLIFEWVLIKQILRLCLFIRGWFYHKIMFKLKFSKKSKKISIQYLNYSNLL